jgi:hypothetical protein
MVGVLVCWVLSLYWSGVFHHHRYVDTLTPAASARHGLPLVRRAATLMRESMRLERLGGADESLSAGGSRR